MKTQKRLLAKAITAGIPDKNSFIVEVSINGELQKVSMTLQEKACIGYDNLHDTCELWGEWEDVPLYVGMSLK